jgi:hypothetical protein
MDYKCQIVQGYHRENPVFLGSIVRTEPIINIIITIIIIIIISGVHS